MARTRSGEDLINDSLARADAEGTDTTGGRNPRPGVLRHVNQGGAELWDLLIEARGPEYWRAPAQSITTTANTTSYDLEDDFYLLISVRAEDSAGDRGEPLLPFSTQEEPSLRDTRNSSDGFPTHYQLRRATDGTNSITVLPVHAAGHTIVVDYVPIFTDLEDDPASVFPGVNGWEEYIASYAAKKMATRDDEMTLVNELRKDMAEIRARIMKLAPKRDMHRARRVKDVRGPRLMGGGRLR